MAEERKYRKGFETGGKISSREEWEQLDLYWLDKTPNERLEAIEELRKQFILFHKIQQGVDWNICGIRTEDV